MCSTIYSKTRLIPGSSIFGVLLLGRKYLVHLMVHLIILSRSLDRIVGAYETEALNRLRGLFTFIVKIQISLIFLYDLL